MSKLININAVWDSLRLVIQIEDVFDFAVIYEQICYVYKQLSFAVAVSMTYFFDTKKWCIVYARFLISRDNFSRFFCISDNAQRFVARETVVLIAGYAGEEFSNFALNRYIGCGFDIHRIQHWFYLVFEVFFAWIVEWSNRYVLRFIRRSFWFFTHRRRDLNAPILGPQG